MTDFNLWKNDITNRFTPSSLTDAIVGSGFVATAIIGGVTTKSFIQYSKWDVYQDLRLKLLGGINYLPISTTTQRDALTGIVDGTVMLNKTTGREEICNSAVWISAAGDGLMAKSSYGSMFQHNHAGDAMNATTKKWITALVGKLDPNGLITFVKDAVNGDYLLVETGGAGDYQIIVTCDVTNAANNETIMEIHINGADSTDLEDKEDTSSTKPRGMAAHGIHALNDADKITLHLESTTSADIVKVLDCHVTIQRVS